MSKLTIFLMVYLVLPAVLSYIYLQMYKNPRNQAAKVLSLVSLTIVALHMLAGIYVFIKHVQP